MSSHRHRKRDRPSEDGASTSIQEGHVSRKKIRLLNVPEKSISTILEDARAVPNHEHSRKYLREFRRKFLPTVQTERVPSVIEQLLSVAAFRSQDNCSAQAAALANGLLNLHIHELSELSVMAVLDRVIDMCSMMEGTKTELHAVLLDMVYTCVHHKQVHVNTLHKVLVLAQQAYNYNHIQMRVSSVRILGECWSVASERVLRILWTSATDCVGAVRECASRSLYYILLGLLERMYREHTSCICIEHYAKLQTLCADTNPVVRVNALNMLHLFAQILPEHRVPSAAVHVQLRLIDQAFVLVCAAMNDLYDTVRQVAATLMGEFKGVNDDFIEQALDKKLLQCMKASDAKWVSVSSRPIVSVNRAAQSRQRRGGRGRGASFHSRTFRQSLSAEWSTGAKLGEDVPVDKTDEDTVIIALSCGALVAALEDEYMAVRLAGVRTLSSLACTPRMAWLSARATDCLADMFNDEISAVRVEAVRCVRPLLHHSPIQHHQLLLMLSCLDDALPECRAAARALLCECVLRQVSSVRAVVRALLKNIKRFPADVKAVHNCLRVVGQQQSTLVQTLATELMGFHPVFATNEPKIEDPFYVGRLVLILNASAQCASVRALFPDYVWRHYHYLRQSSPQLVQGIQAPSKTLVLSDTNKCKLSTSIVELEVPDKDTALAISHTSTAHCERALLTVMRAVDNDLTVMDRLHILHIVKRDLEQLCGLYGEIDRVSDWLLACVSLLLAYYNLQQLLPSLTTLATKWTTQHKQFVNDLMRMRCVYTNLSAACERFLQQMNRAAQLYEAAAALQQTTMVKADPDAAADVRSELQALYNTLDVSGLMLPSVLLKTATLITPEPVDAHDDLPLVRFVAPLVTSLDLVAHVHHLDSTDLTHRLHVQVTYPDRSVHRQKVQAHCIKEINTNTHSVNTQVLLQSTLWSDAATVHIQLVLLVGVLGQSQIVPLAHDILKVRLQPKTRC